MHNMRQQAGGSYYSSAYCDQKFLDKINTRNLFHVLAQRQPTKIIQVKQSIKYGSRISLTNLRH